MQYNECYHSHLLLVKNIKIFMLCDFGFMVYLRLHTIICIYVHMMCKYIHMHISFVYMYAYLYNAIYKSIINIICKELDIHASQGIYICWGLYMHNRLHVYFMTIWIYRDVSIYMHVCACIHII